METYTKYNVIVYPLTKYAGFEYKTQKKQFTNITDARIFIREFINSGEECNMIEIQEELELISKNKKKCTN